MPKVMQKTIVVAVGGNALGNSPKEQSEIVKKTARYVASIVFKGENLVLVHGNGPQIGMINDAFNAASQKDKKIPMMPLPESGAMSQGYIGYQLQQAINNEFNQKNHPQKIATIVTETIVDAEDNAFKNPSKPIGPFMKENEAKAIANKEKWIVKEDAGRGWRRVVPSPQPKTFVELPIIQKLNQSGLALICAGGGGVPVIEKNNSYEGVAAVIDKDLAAARLAILLGAENLIILTAVDFVYLNYNKPNQKQVTKMTISEAKSYIKKHYFAEGSMLPKIEAVVKFVEATHRSAYIGGLDKIEGVLKGSSGTEITWN